MTSKDNQSETTVEGPPFGHIDVEYRIAEEDLEDARAAYERAQADGYDEPLTTFLAGNTLLGDETISVDDDDTPT